MTVFFDDVKLVEEMVAKYGAQPSFIECGGLENPTIADYSITIREMSRLAMSGAVILEPNTAPGAPEGMVRVRDADDWEARTRAAQHARYLQIHRPLEKALPGYVLEDPATGGLPIERLSEKYDREIGTAVLLSVLEHVSDPFTAAATLYEAMAPGGLVIVSVPWIFPHHPSPEDNWRFSPSGLRYVFRDEEWDVKECDWRLKIPADAGVLEIHTMKPQAIESCYLVAKARP